MFEGWQSADWPAPPSVKAGVSTRKGGFSEGPYAGLNLGHHVGDDAKHVAANRAKLLSELNDPGHVYWLNQVHSTIVLNLDQRKATDTLEDADGAITTQTKKVLCVLSGDCLPILICNRKGTEIAALHGGWRGLAQGIIAASLSQMKSGPEDCLVWLGPAISAQNYEVGEEVYAAFFALDPTNAEAFTKNERDRWQCDLYALARLALNRCGISEIYGGQYCTFQQEDLFYSYRRQSTTGRQASLIWME